MDQDRMERIERDLEELQGVRAARLRADGDQIQEVHIVASAARGPKGIVRDVVTTLFACHEIRLNFKKVSVAVMGQGEIGAMSESAGAGDGHRMEFLSVNTLLQGTRVEAQVELSWAGGTLLGTRMGANTPEARLRLVAEATLEALQQATRDGCQWSLADVTTLRLGQTDAVAAKVLFLASRRRQEVAGCALVHTYMDEAVVFAVLQSINRAASPFLKPIWTEYEISPEAGAGRAKAAGTDGEAAGGS